MYLYESSQTYTILSVIVNASLCLVVIYQHVVTEGSSKLMTGHWQCFVENPHQKINPLSVIGISAGFHISALLTEYILALDVGI